MEPPTEAALHLDTNGALTNEPIFVGEFQDACRFAWAMTPSARLYARIEADGWTYPAAELESMRREDCEV